MYVEMIDIQSSNIPSTALHRTCSLPTFLTQDFSLGYFGINGMESGRVGNWDICSLVTAGANSVWLARLLSMVSKSVLIVGSPLPRATDIEMGVCVSDPFDCSGWSGSIVKTSGFESYGS